ncbi:response regulator [Sphingomicrobium lutaoense]|uniref:DNA-binding response OmpR family regulator n=1 Tax=Sphingomicrobium lutaoense TaxID=515949 RepID=A0A839Z1K2_9SPHN|nr:response regulator [Sphingomicrobium lutaoense]MBB3763465.1 DNA-binding response OmpR family regulator [Sphingomicrobium lutaoense]
MTQTQPRLLLIDDEPALAEFLAGAATSSGFQPIIADDHEHFRRCYVEDSPELVAIDLGMPGMDGIELLRFLAEQKACQPILIISGFDRRILESAFNLGEEMGLKMVGPVSKPARLEELEMLLVQLREQLVR